MVDTHENPEALEPVNPSKRFFYLADGSTRVIVEAKNETEARKATQDLCGNATGSRTWQDTNPYRGVWCEELFPFYSGDARMIIRLTKGQGL